MAYVILCKTIPGDLATWWGPDRCGYTQNLDLAGRYTREEAEAIEKIRGEDRAYPESAVLSQSFRAITTESLNQLTKEK